jgi:glycosyltransferase involved in cell wall biosynthesis
LKDKSNVLFTGRISNVDKYLQSSDFYITTSLSEGFHLAVIEAMACGLPVLSSDIDVHQYILHNQTTAGFFFETSNEKDLLEKIYKLLTLDYQEYSKNAITLVRNNFSAKVMSKKYQKYYLSLLEV